MDSVRLFFDPPPHANMFFTGNGDSFFRGTRSMINMEETSKRRSFFSSPGELYDDEYYDDQLPEKKRRLSPDQVHLLEKSFETENKLEPDQKSELAKKLGLQPRQVAVWFQNRRARWKTKQLERDYDRLKSNYDSLLSNYDSILKDKDKLKAELVSLTEKLQAKEVIGIPESGPKSDPLPADEIHVSTIELKVKVEDRLSSGSGSGSAVVDELDGPQLVDSGDSYLAKDDYPGSVAEDDGGSDEGQNYFSNVVFMAEEQQHPEEGEPLGWWDWS